MSNQRDNNKQRKNDHLLKNLPTEVLVKARSTLFSLSGALKSRQEQTQQPKQRKPDKDKKSHERLKNSRSEPEFSEVKKNKHRSLVDQERRQHAGAKPRPLSVGAVKRYDKVVDDYHNGNHFRDVSPLPKSKYGSSEEVCVQSRLIIPVGDRLSPHDAQDERPRKKLSFREPEIVGHANATLGRSTKLMGVNSLTRRPNRQSLRNEPLYSSLEALDSDLESQAMRIVRTVGQAFEVCHKMQSNPDQPEASTSSAVDDQLISDRASDVPPCKEAASECDPSETGAASTSKVEGVAGGEDQHRPKHLELLPPPPRKDSRRSPQRATPAPAINLPDLPECVTKVEVTSAEVTGGGGDEGGGATPLTAHHQAQLLRERLEQQAQQTRAAVAQLLLLRDQLAAEQAARCEAQARTHQLLVHNKELLEHIAALVAHLQERERGSSRPISTHQLTLLPQCCRSLTKNEEATNNMHKTENTHNCNGNHTQYRTDSFLNLITQSNRLDQNYENNNVRLSPYSVSPAAPATPTDGPTSAPSFSNMSNEQIQNYLISKFQDMGGFPNGCTGEQKKTNQQYFQNSNAFPNIPPLTNHYSNMDLASLMNHKAYKQGCSAEELSALARAMSVGQSENSLYSTSQATTSKDSIPDAYSSDDGPAFIMPLSHNATLTATGEDGRVRLIVPVSPSGSSTNVPVFTVTEENSPSGATLKVPGPDMMSRAAAAPIIRSTSEKVPNRSEMMTALRSQWTRHTTK